MAAIDTSRPIAGGRLFGGRLTRVIARVYTWNANRATRKELNRLTDHELEDIGLVRGDIDNIV